MEFFLHIMYFLYRGCERVGLQGVLFRRREETHTRTHIHTKLYIWCGERVGRSEQVREGRGG